MSDDLMERIRTAMEEYEESSALAIISNDSVVSALGRRLHRYHQAHRKMLELHDQSEAHGDFTYCRACGTTARPCETLRALAEAYGIETEGNRS